MKPREEVKKSERKSLLIGQKRFTREEEEFINELIDKRVAAVKEGAGKGVAAGYKVVAAVRVIQKPGQQVKKKDGAPKVLKEVSKCSQVWDTLKFFVPDAPIAELHDELMKIMEEGFWKVETKQTKLKGDVPEVTRRERKLLR